MKTKNKKVGILGMGEIGSSLARFYPVHFAKDLKRDEFPKDLDVMHVCIPYSKDFVRIVRENIEAHCKNGLVVIHSTVPVGTTKKISARHKFTVHSPNRGVHPNLYEGIKTFVKYIGCDFSGAGRIASEHFEDLGITTEVIFNSNATEALKIWDTTYYGWNILFQKEVYRWCKKNKLNFDVVYTMANSTYNRGYWELGRGDVIRPVLRQVDGGIGGHCVISNAKLLNTYITKELLKQNKKYDKKA